MIRKRVTVSLYYRRFPTTRAYPETRWLLSWEFYILLRLRFPESAEPPVGPVEPSRWPRPSDRGLKGPSRELQVTRAMPRMRSRGTLSRWGTAPLELWTAAGGISLFQSREPVARMAEHNSWDGNCVVIWKVWQTKLKRLMFDFDLLSCLQQIPLEICERLENIRRRKQFQFIITCCSARVMNHLQGKKQPWWNLNLLGYNWMQQQEVSETNRKLFIRRPVLRIWQLLVIWAEVSFTE